MIRVLVFLALVLGAGLIAVWIADQSGTINIVIDDTRYQTSLGVGFVILVAVATILSILWALLRLLTRGPDALSGFMRNRRRAKGLDAIARGLVAVGTGDERSARKSARDALRLIPGNTLTEILAAQAAQLSGNHAAAENAFRDMLDRAETRALGLRGLYVEAYRRGDAQAARDLAEESLRTAPEAPWAGPALLDFQCAEGDWAAALTTVERNTANRVTNRATSKRQRAVLLTAQAIQRADRDEEDALAPALEAVKLAPDLVPAAVIAARMLAESGDPKRAMKIVENAWKTCPHPDLAEIYLRARPGDTAQDRLKKAKALAARNENHPEGALALARAALDARDFTLARAALKPLIEDGPTVRTCLLMAEIEDVDQGSRAVARGWLARAVSAKRDPAWIADGVAVPAWAPVSPATGKLDGLVWGTPRDAWTHASPTVETILDEQHEPRQLIESTPPPKPISPKHAAPEAEAFPPPPDDPGPRSNPLADEGAPPQSRATVFGPP